MILDDYIDQCSQEMWDSATDHAENSFFSKTMSGTAERKNGFLEAIIIDV